MTLLKASFEAVLADIRSKFVTARAVPVQSWQSVAAPQPMPEVLNYSFTLDLSSLGFGPQVLDDLRHAIRPNLPWADDHFVKERVSGRPINPGTTWRQWPFARSADKHRREGEEDPLFDHSYAERYWPKMAGGGALSEAGGESERVPHQGIRFRYGDLADLVTLMGMDPLTRQAYLPVWFPEDLAAAVESKRVPCTLGYHCIYPMRSCDFVRHFRDDVYLTIRLQLWLLGMLAFKHPVEWKGINMGTFTMHITSLHLFQQDKDNIIRSFQETR